MNVRGIYEKHLVTFDDDEAKTSPLLKIDCRDRASSLELRELSCPTVVFCLNINNTRSTDGSNIVVLDLHLHNAAPKFTSRSDTIICTDLEAVVVNTVEQPTHCQSEHP